MKTITWQWNREDWELWYQAYQQGAAYREQCRGVQAVCVVVAVLAGFVVGLRSLTSWWLLLLVLALSGVLAALLARGFLALYIRRQIAQLIAARFAQPGNQESYTLTIEDDGLRIKMDGSEHWYAWRLLESASLADGGFLSITIQGAGSAFQIPPRAFSTIEQRDAFLGLLTPNTTAAASAQERGPWWRQRQGLGG
jgi:membrane protein implicated in regulation of membrane protease activity